MPGWLELREGLALAAKRAYRRGIQTGSGGNVSARIPGRELMLVKASGSSFEDSSVDGFVVADFDGKLVEGAGKPTREALLHGYLYRICPWMGAVVHAHSPYAIAWAATGKALPLTTWHAKLKLPAEIPALNVPSPMVRTEDFPLVKAIYDATPDLPAFLLVDHGVVAGAADAVNAEHTAELVEETAKIAYLKAVAAKLGL
ncbi:MAG: class II aldolase/adducin family protein [Planctomycetota bacterium]|jgi:L-ribulose-5-phosphate 4-epimerase|nr:class II aldolase/adducin family protein [Planctomycetota bacterium]